MMWKRIARMVITGIGMGSFMYLLALAAGFQESMPSPKNIVSIWVMSGLIGILTLLFATDRLSFLTALLLHIVGVTLLVLAMAIFNGWSSWVASPAFWSELVGIYAAVWAVERVQQYLSVTRINQALAARRNAQKPPTKP